jgi:hypothetical protein
MLEVWIMSAGMGFASLDFKSYARIIATLH